jgi:L-iditol 2-dehydrogenase
MPLGPLGFITLDNVDPPALPGPDWVRIGTTLSGICGSDLAAIKARDSFLLEPFQTYPFTFGHENIGSITELGGAVSGWQLGERVAVSPMLACRQRAITPLCDACARGDYGLCNRTTEGRLSPGFMTGYCADVGGGWSGSFVAHESQLLRLPPVDALPDQQAVLLDPFASALRPVLLHAPRDGDVPLVIGAGSIGLLTIYALRLTGWEGPIVALGRYPFQLEQARRAGAEPVFASRGQLYRWAASLPGARAYKPTLAPRFVEGGPTLVYDTVASHTTLADALAVTAGGGRIIVVGSTAHLSLDWTRLVIRNIMVAGVFAYGPVPRDGQERDIYPVALELLGADALRQAQLVTHVFGLEEYRAAIAAALDKNGHRSVKVVFRPGD